MEYYKLYTRFGGVGLQNGEVNTNPGSGDQNTASEKSRAACRCFDSALMRSPLFPSKHRWTRVRAPPPMRISAAEQIDERPQQVNLQDISQDGLCIRKTYAHRVAKRSCLEPTWRHVPDTYGGDNQVSARSILLATTKPAMTAALLWPWWNSTPLGADMCGPHSDLQSRSCTLLQFHAIRLLTVRSLWASGRHH